MRIDDKLYMIRHDSRFNLLETKLMGCPYYNCCETVWNGYINLHRYQFIAVTVCRMLNEWRLQSRPTCIFILIMDSQNYLWRQPFSTTITIFVSLYCYIMWIEATEINSLEPNSRLWIDAACSQCWGPFQSSVQIYNIKATWNGQNITK